MKEKDLKTLFDKVKEAEFILSNVPRTRAELRALRYEK